MRSYGSENGRGREALGKLLHDLEGEINNVYDINTKVKYEENTSTNESDAVSICTSLLDDIIVGLTFDEVLCHEKPKSFEFGLIESDEEFSYSFEPKLEKLVPPALEDPARGKAFENVWTLFLTLSLPWQIRSCP